MKDEIIAAVAQGWCTKENENKTMDSVLAMAIVENVMVIIEKLEARLADAGTIQTEYCETIEYIEKLESTIAKHERREDSHVKRIEELISSKGIKELEAVADAVMAELKSSDSSDNMLEVKAALKEAGKLK